MAPGDLGATRSAGPRRSDPAWLAEVGIGPKVELLPRPRALYVHVPFCPQICPYCDFHKMRRNEALVTRYLRRLTEELAAGEGALSTVYFGGGTPSHLTDSELEEIVAAIQSAHGWPPYDEVTLEADPLTFDRPRLQRWLDLGITRLSIGVQSMDDAVLQFLGRGHTSSDARAAVLMALDAGFEVSVDIIVAVPGQGAVADLTAVVGLGAPHVSVYNLTVEPFTPFAFRGVRVDPERDADDFDAAARVLGRFGYRRYEVSNHARRGHEALHNAAYWRGDTFLAGGPGAAAFLPMDPDASAFRPRGPGASDSQGVVPHRGRTAGSPVDVSDDLVGRRLTNPRMKGWLSGEPPAVDPITPVRYVQDAMLTGLRTTRGVDLACLARRSGIDLRPSRIVRRLEQEGLLTLEADILKATGEGLRRLNAVVMEFL
jgi:oxygen-independent coproporphyrinogen-3 oxidase